MKVGGLKSLFSLIALQFSVSSLNRPWWTGRPPIPLIGRQIHEFPKPTYLHDLCAASNGNVLVASVVPRASICSVSGSTTSTPVVSLVHTFDHINLVTGIVETQSGVFAMVGGNQSSIGARANGTFGVWELDLRSARPLIQQIVHIPESGYLLGVEVLPCEPTTLLISYGARSLVWRVETLTRQYQIAIQDPKMQFPQWRFTPQGIDGIRIHGRYLYWSNSYIASICRIPIDDQGQVVEGAKSRLVKEVTSIFLEKFAIGSQGEDTIWATTNEGNRLFAITPEGRDTVVAGAPDQMALTGCTAAAFGRLKNDTNTLYVIMSGGLDLPVNGTITEGGKLVALNTAARRLPYR